MSIRATSPPIGSRISPAGVSPEAVRTGNIVPDRDISRAEMAVLLLKTSISADYVPPTATGLVFSDVHPGDFAADWIEDLFTRNISAGCDNVPNYCPDRSVSRAEMAVFLTKTFNLPLP